MDAFYASVEQRDFPQYRGKPLVVGGQSGRGVVAAASYEARKYGVKSAMPYRTAIKRCPFLISVAPRMSIYKEISQQIRNIFYEYTDLVEPLSFDEAFLDVTNPKKGGPSASLIAKEIKARIYSELNLVASAGVSYNKFLAKIASDEDKPNGFFLIRPEDAEIFMDNLSINKFFGVGKVTAKKFNDLGVYSGADLRRWNKPDLVRIFGRSGAHYYAVVRGVDSRPVVPYRERKSVGVERTFFTDIYKQHDVEAELEKVVDELWIRLHNSKREGGRVITVKIKFADFRVITRRETLQSTLLSIKTVRDVADRLTPFQQIYDNRCRLLGVTISGFEDDRVNDNSEAYRQLTIPFEY